MNLRTFVNKTIRAFRQGRVREAALSFYTYCTLAYPAMYRGWKFDRKYGVDTRAVDLGLSVNRGALSKTIASSNSAQNTGFRPSDPKLLNGMFDVLRIPFGDYTFIDLGSGTGRVLLIASEFPFKKIIGIEFCPPVCEKSRENIRRYKSTTQKCKNIEAICMDALHYQIPDDLVVIFLSNPFQSEELLRGVLNNIKASLLRRPRQIYVIYCVPWLAQVIQESGFLDKIHVQPYLFVYRSAEEFNSDDAFAVQTSSGA
jgi:SAM-dependent methyltransferase